MLVALERDPGACGYRPEQVAECLAALPARGIHQEQAGIAQLAHMLRERGVSRGRPWAGSGRGPAPRSSRCGSTRSARPCRPCPGTSCGPSRPSSSSTPGAPSAAPGRVWVETSLAEEVESPPPYPFESASESPGGGERRDNGTFVLGELTWPEAEERFRQVDVALLPVGSLEQHGPHLPLDTDAFDADQMARRCSAGRSFESMASVFGFAASVSWGALVGVLAGFALVYLLSRARLARSLQAVVTLASVLGAFIAAGALREDSGYVSVVLMGAILANQSRVATEHIHEFKETIGLLLTGVLFIVLSARITPSQLLDAGPPACCWSRRSSCWSARSRRCVRDRRW